MSGILKRTVPMALVFIIGILVIADFFLKMPQLQSGATFLVEVGVILSSFALGLGVANMTWVHARNVQKRTKGQWMHSIVLLFGIYVVFGAGLIGGTGNPVFSFFFDNVIAVAGVAVYAVLSFHTINAAYRSFTARNVYAAVMMIVAIIVFLGMVPAGELLSPSLPVVQMWLQDYPNVGALRALQIGAAVAAIILTVKTLLGIERAYLGVESGE